MNYCSNCSCAVDGRQCPICGRTSLRPIRPDDYCFLTELEDMWCSLYLEVLRDNGIAHTKLPTVGFGGAAKTGTPMQFRVFVPYEKAAEALELLKQTFPD